MRSSLYLKLAAAPVALAVAVATPANAQSIAQLDGARYVCRIDRGGVSRVIVYRIRGNSVTRTSQDNVRGRIVTGKPESFPIRNGAFYTPMPIDACLSLYQTDECGILVTIKDDALYSSLRIDGRSSTRFRYTFDCEVIRRQR
jgi:hypothetical protein